MNKLVIKTIDGGVSVSGIDGISLVNTFECGQCFRFELTESGAYEGIAFGKHLVVGQKSDSELVFYGSDENEVREYWIPFLDLERNYGEIIATFTDSRLIEAANACAGIRILRQNPWEALVSFIISQNNNIPRIKKIIRLLCEHFGEKVNGGYAFPSAKRVLEGDLSVIRSGFREKYIKDAAEKVVSGEIDLDALGLLTFTEAKQQLIRIKGVGEKVATCVCLFGLGFLEAFPVDTWVKRILANYYESGFDITSFGAYAGVAQQYLFHYERIKAGV